MAHEYEGNMVNEFEVVGIPPKEWQREPPSESGYWWWWNGDFDSPPVPVNIEWDPADGGRYFATRGQHGWNHHLWADSMGGFWMPLPEPSVSKND